MLLLVHAKSIDLLPTGSRGLKGLTVGLGTRWISRASTSNFNTFWQKSKVHKPNVWHDAPTSKISHEALCALLFGDTNVLKT